MNRRYKHKKKVHNLTAPKEIVPVLNNIFKPLNVVDVGCGLGNFLQCFKNEGVTEVLGIDGSWVDWEKLSQYISENEFLEQDLETKINLNRKFDLVLSLEVAEHLAKEKAGIFVRNLVSLGNIIIFSAAIPGQGGQNHINEQWLSYWEELFLAEGFVLHDILRPLFWENDKINWWYRQNMVVFAHNTVYVPNPLPVNSITNVVHPELFKAKIAQQMEKSEKVEKLLVGKSGSWLYFKLLVKSLIKY